MPLPETAHTQQLAASCTLVLFGCLTVSGVLSDPRFRELPRTLDVLELWSGAGTVVRAAQSIGLQAQGFDKFRIVDQTLESEDLCTLTGVSNAITLLMSIVEGGLLVEAPCCSSWTWPNVAKTQRHHSISGNTEYDKVRQGNIMAQVAALMFILALCRGVNVVMENPPHSYMWKYLEPHFRPYGFLVDVSVERCAFDKNKGPKLGKKYKFRGSGPWIQALTAWRCSCKEPHLQCMTVSSHGKKTGNENLKASQVYPIQLGEAIVQVWQNGFHDAGSISEAASSDGPTFAVSGVRRPPDQLDPWADLHVAPPAQAAKRQKQGPRISSVSQSSATTSMDPWEGFVGDAALDSNEDPSASHEAAGGQRDIWCSIAEDCSAPDSEDPWAGL